MKTYTSFAISLNTFLGSDQAVKLTVDGYMPLCIEHIGMSDEGHQRVALAHTGMQNGDVMYDPEMVFQLHDWGELQAAEPISFRNDYMGLHQEVYRYNEEGKATHVNVRLKAELKSFARTWFRNLKEQGFLSPQAIRERLA